MSKANIILIGAGGHASACIDVIEQHGKYQIAGMVGLREEVHRQRLGYTVFATDDDLPRLANEYRYAAIAFGQLESPDLRIGTYQRLLKLGFELPAIVAPSAYVSPHATIGAGTIIMHGAIVNAGASIGKNGIINTRALIEQDVAVGDHCHISTNAILNGAVRVGAGSFLGSGCVVKDSVEIGKNCVIGMGLSVRHDQADNTRFTGHKKS
jgi:sugar O-acyltransferase (sialic acid O-acetyltransferase NeuD family)